MTVYDLWLPIVATGLATHVWSTLAWVVLPHHKTEWVKFPGVFWFRRKIAMDLLDGFVFAMLTGVIFSALWPA